MNVRTKFHGSLPLVEHSTSTHVLFLSKVQYSGTFSLPIFYFVYFHFMLLLILVHYITETNSVLYSLLIEASINSNSNYHILQPPN